MLVDVFNDYPKHRPKPESTNDELVCFYCKKPVNEIGNKLELHAKDCKYRLKKESLNK